MSNITAIFLSIILQSFPYIIIGSLAGAMIELFLPAEKVSRWSGKNNFKSIILFASLGFILPICECGIIPVVKRLRGKGVPTGPLVAYLLSAPAFQPIVMFSTYSAFNNNIQIALIRCFGSLVIAVITANLVKKMINEKKENHIHDEHCCDSHEHLNHSIHSHSSEHQYTYGHTHNDEKKHHNENERS